MRPEELVGVLRRARPSPDLSSLSSPPFLDASLFFQPEIPGLVQKLRSQRPQVPEFFTFPPTPVVPALRAQQPEPYRLPDGYKVHVNDDSVIDPFAISNELIDIIRRETRHCSTREAKARRIFDWMQEHIDYRKRGFRPYATSLETFRRGGGVCGEQAFLYVSMARSTGLRSGYVSVSRDYKHKKVHHGCASVDIERGRILVDPAYHTFDIKHCKYEHLRDVEIIDRFYEWRTG
ncbi:transglutaminase domain-containing protein [Candidatus Woesearchaeota archaeon]|nr:transglutaminase domain-containing protein [Candidatus Woesearchaeota archaeon]